jgi:hypothetical protein
MLRRLQTNSTESIQKFAISRNFDRFEANQSVQPISSQKHFEIKQGFQSLSPSRNQSQISLPLSDISKSLAAGLEVKQQRYLNKLII